MKTVISPAKSLDYESELPTDAATQPLFLEKAQTLNDTLAQKSKSEISGLMSISENLTNLNYERYQNFSVPFTRENARPAIYAFDGAAYKGLDAYTIPDPKIELLQDSLRILSGMYGLLRPLDLMQPYRLEMGTKLLINGHSNLYEFWGNSLTAALNKELKKDELFINLASKEYFKVLKPEQLKTDIIRPVFKDFKNGELKVISFYAKKARGQMVRYLVNNEIKTLKGIRGFSVDDYGYSQKYTESENEPVFIR